MRRQTTMVLVLTVALVSTAFSVWVRPKTTAAGAASMMRATETTQAKAAATGRPWVRAPATPEHMKLELAARESVRQRHPLVHDMRAGAVVVWAVGDLCDDHNEKLDCADVGRLISKDKATDAVLALGDLQYPDGELKDFRKFYNPKMGSGPRLRSRTFPVLGNHEYGTTDAKGYFTYWGSRAGPRGRGYYAATLGSWLLVVANSNCPDYGGCKASSAQGKFVLKKLRSTRRCSVVATHHPAIADGGHTPGDSDGKEVFDRAFDGRADLFLSGHDHSYQRFAPRNKALAVDRRRGVPQFVVGTGGRGLTSFGSEKNRSVYRQNKHFGALRLRLGRTGYSFRFVNIAGKTMDDGKRRCH